MEDGSNLTLGISLGAVAALTALLLGIATFDPHGLISGPLIRPGRVLVDSFHLVAWWVPVYFLILAAFAFSPLPMRWPALILLNALHLPMITAAMIVRLITFDGVPGAILIDLFVSGFSLRGALLIGSLLLAIEGILYAQLWRILRRRADSPDSAETIVRSLPAPLSVEAVNARIGGGSSYAESHTNDEEPAEEFLSERIEELTEEPDGENEDATDTEPPSVAQSTGDITETLAALRRRLQPDDEAEIEPPLPLLLRRRRGAPARPVVGTEGLEDAEEIDDVNELDDLNELDEEVFVPDSGIPARSSRGRRYSVPVAGVLDEYGDGRYWEIDDSTRDAAEVLRVTLEEFGIRAEVTGIRKGPVITMFEILPAPGVKLAKITNLADNIALRLAASSVRIVAPIPGKHAVGIEIPNRQRHLVSFAELLLAEEFFGDSTEIPIALGKDISGEAQIVDLTKTPHMLIAGATGSGKSVCVNSIICSVLYRRSPAEVKLILIDPKIVELKFYNDIPHLLTPVITDPKRAFQALQYLIYEMERRYSLLDSMGARDISGFNARIRRKNLATEPIPYIVVIIDEFADLMATSGKELESTVARLAAMSRAVGIHLVLATQRPSTDVITGLIKANIPSRIAFMVASKVDSRIIIDAMGAEKLLGRGDMLFTSAADPFPVRMQGAFLSEDEVERVVEMVKEYGEPDYIDDEIFIDEEDDDLGDDYLEDPLLERAIEVITTSRKASASYLQRRLKVGYNRAARMVEEMERMGLVGPQNGSKPREVITS